MGKRPSMQWYPGDWLRDPGVQMASFQTRGIWFEILNIMWDTPMRGVLTGKPERLARLIGCTIFELEDSVAEIEELNIGDVSRQNGVWFLTCRRMVRDDEVRASERDRKTTGKHLETLRKLSGNSPENVRTLARARVGAEDEVEEEVEVEREEEKEHGKMGGAGGKEPAAGWAAFWSAYPRKVAKRGAFAAWNAAAPDDETRTAIGQDLARRLASGEWKTGKTDAQYIPHAATYLRGERWMDERNGPALAVAQPEPDEVACEICGALTDGTAGAWVLSDLDSPPRWRILCHKCGGEAETSPETAKGTNIPGDGETAPSEPTAAFLAHSEATTETPGRAEARRDRLLDEMSEHFS